MEQVQDVVARLETGADLEAIERELIAARPWLEPEERDALWLFAWAYRERARPLLGSARV